MPSPFPGMDPFIESQERSGFHAQFIAQLVRSLVPKARPRYEVEPGYRPARQRHGVGRSLIAPEARCASLPDLIGRCALSSRACTAESTVPAH
jgi:hypothetical protein